MKRTLLLIPLALLLTGCPPAKPPRLTGTGMDMFAPTRMRLHPLTRITPAAPAANPPTASAKPALEVRLEFTDQFGDITKGVGTVFFELHRFEILGAKHKGERIELWNADLTTPQINQQHWDSITRTYLFNLGIKRESLPPGDNRFVLSATFNLPNGHRFTDDMTLNLRQ